MGTYPLIVSNYCERTDGQFWAEPLNAATNLAFFVAAAFILYKLRGHGRSFWDIRLMAALLLAVGTGSFLWHSLATPWAQWMDVIPIILLINLFLLSFLVRVARLKVAFVVAVFGLYQVLNYCVHVGLPKDWLNGSVFYLPTLVALFVMAVYCRFSARSFAPYVYAMAIMFAVSLTFRSIDMAVCPAFQSGTHFIWHMLNALVVYVGLRMFIDEAISPETMMLRGQ